MTEGCVTPVCIHWQSTWAHCKQHATWDIPVVLTEEHVPCTQSLSCCPCSPSPASPQQKCCSLVFDGVYGTLQVVMALQSTTLWPMSITWMLMMLANGEPPMRWPSHISRAGVCSPIAVEPNATFRPSSRSAALGQPRWMKLSWQLMQVCFFLASSATGFAGMSLLP